MNFERYLSDFNSTIVLSDFLINFFLVAFLALILKWFYTTYGRCPSDRDGFSNNFLVLALATFLIITVIKSSIALSLGLVGALSIVRFRAAIKDPEELTYLFLIIGLGVVGGANKPILSAIFFPLILIIIFVVNRYSVRKKVRNNSSIVHIESAVIDSVEVISDAMTKTASYVEFRKRDSHKDSNTYSFICTFDSVQDIDRLIKSLKTVDADVRISLIDQPQLIV